MSHLEEIYKEKLKELETALEDPANNDWQRESITNRIAEYKRKIEVVENMELDKVSADMKAILSHTHAIDEKYECRSVKFMFRVAEFVEKYLSFALGKKIAEYTVKKIHAPVCSIVAGSKPELPPMPQYSDPSAGWYEEWRRAQDEEMKKFRTISVNFLEKPPTLREKISIKYSKFVRNLLPQQEKENG